MAAADVGTIQVCGVQPQATGYRIRHGVMSMATVPKGRSHRPADLPHLPARNGRPGEYFLRIPANAYTLSGFRAWIDSDEFPEKLRATFLNGTILLDMSMEDLTAHNKVKTAVTTRLVALDPDEEVGSYYADGARVTNDEADVSNQPDGVYFTWETVDAGLVRLVEREGEEGCYMEIEGSPDWVMEVVSNSSVRKDTVDLRRAYHRAGIREYWLIDARGEEIDFQILVWRKNGYVAARRKDGWQHSPVFGRSFRMTRTRHKRGIRIYHLEVKPA
jgi:Uma2 family endonuclease